MQSASANQNTRLISPEEVLLGPPDTGPVDWVRPPTAPTAPSLPAVPAALPLAVPRPRASAPDPGQPRPPGPRRPGAALRPPWPAGGVGGGSGGGALRGPEHPPGGRVRALRGRAGPQGPLHCTLLDREYPGSLSACYCTHLLYVVRPGA